MSSALDFGNLDELATLLKSGGVRSVSADPARVNTPGVWINPKTVRLDLLDGCVIPLDLVCVVASSEYRTSSKALADLFNQVVDALHAGGLGGPEVDAVIGSVLLPGSTSPLPCISIPLDLHTS